MEFHAIGGEDILKDLAHFLSHNAREWGVLHTNDGDGVVGRERVSDFHTDEGGADDDNILFLLLAYSGEDVLDVFDSAEKEDIFEVFKAWEGQLFGSAARGENQSRVRDGAFARSGSDGFLGEVDAGDFILKGLNAGFVVPGLSPPFEFGRFGDQGFGELGAVEGKVGFAGDDGDAAFEVLFS